MKANKGLAAIVLMLPALCWGGEMSFTPEAYRELALKNNSALRQTRLAAQAADQTAKMAFTGYFPKISAAGIAANTNLLPNSAISGIPLIPALFGAENDIAVSMLTVQQPLFAGGRIYNDNLLARAGRAAAELQLRLKRDEVIAGAETRYYTLRVLAEKKRTLEAYSTLLNALSAQVEQAFAGGLVTRTDVLRVNLKKAEVALNRSTLEKGTALAEEDFMLFADIPAGTTIYLAADTEEITEPVEKKKDLPYSLTQRAEYKLLETGANVARLQTAMKRGEYLPTVAVGASLYRLDYFKNGDNRFQNSAAFGLVSVPLNWWEAFHAIKEKKLTEAASKDRLKETGDYLLLDLENKLKDYEDAYQRVDLGKLSVEEAKANRSEKEDGYKNGTEKLSDLLEALALEQQTMDSLEEAKAAYFEKKAVFLLATGKQLNVPPNTVEAMDD